ncbi:MAG: type IV pilin protein, partial [Candidatus Methylomirabilales bacterium]
MSCALENERGFTLTELVIMMVVVGLLATIAIPRYV